VLSNSPDRCQGQCNFNRQREVSTNTLCGSPLLLAVTRKIKYEFLTIPVGCFERRKERTPQLDYHGIAFGFIKHTSIVVVLTRKLNCMLQNAED